MSKLDVLEKIILNENVYIYKKISAKIYPKKTIEDVFRAAKKDKEDDRVETLFSLINNPGNISGANYKFSALVLKYSNTPSFLTEYVKNWEEKKIAYLFVLDFGEYLILSKKNISGIQSFISSLEPLGYEVLAKLFVTDQTLFEKFSLQNLDISSKAVRAKSVESENLPENYNYLGSNTYIINHLRLNNDTQRYVISLNSSRISKAGDKSKIEKFVGECFKLIQSIRKFKDIDCFLDVFAKPCSYTDQRKALSPSSVTIFYTKLLDDLTNGKISHVIYNYNGTERKINLVKYLRGLSSTASLEPIHGSLEFMIEADVYSPVGDLKVVLNEKSIRIASSKLSRMKIHYGIDSKDSLSSYLNSYNLFLVNFDQCEYVYSNRRLFKDSQLLGNIEQFLKIFIPDVKLSKIASEKGKIKASSVTFDKDCVFGYVEERFSGDQFLVLDDLGDEWADHISINGSKISFIHSKCSDAVFSATAFTDIIGQAQKNIGNIFAIDNAILNKRDKWIADFNLGGKSQIKRLRNGASVDDFIKRYQEIKIEPNSQKAIVLALNFISKKKLEANLNRLKAGEQFGERRQAIQILWFISSLIASCRENSVEVSILCKP